MLYPVNPVNWFFYSLLGKFLNDVSCYTIPDNRPTLYLHATIYSPFRVLWHAMYRFTIYEMFLYNNNPDFFKLIMSSLVSFSCRLPPFRVKKYLLKI